MSASQEVIDAFDRSEQYAREASVKLASFTSALNTSIYAPPTISVTWNSLTPPTLPDIPNAPTMPSIVVNMPTDEPTGLMLDEPTVVIDDFTEVAPTVVIGDAPVLSYGATPSVPAVADVAMPVAEAVILPADPSYLSLSVVSFGGIDIHEDWLTKLETIPELSLLSPTPFSYARGPEYASALLDALKAKLVERMAGGTGLSAAVEAAIWDRARDRETSVALSNEAEIQRQSEALGFSLPPGTLAAQLREAQQATYDKVSTLSRDIAIKQAELEQDNLKTTISQGMELEGKLVDYSFKLEQLTFETAKQYADNAIQIYNAGVDGYKALLSGYKMYADVYDTIIKAELAKLEEYKGLLQAEQTKADINRVLVEQYKAAVDAQMSKVEIYKAQVSAAQTLVQLEGTKINAAGEQIRAYTAQINAETAKVEAYKAEIMAEQAKVDIYKTKVQAYSAKVGAQSEKARADISYYTAMVQAKTAEWEGFKTKVQAESERVRALGLQSSSMLDGFKAEAAAIEAEANMHTKVWETQIKDYEAGQNIVLQAAKINNDAAIQANNARLEAAKVGAQVYSQLTASAYSMTHASASISSSAGFGINYSYGNDTTSAASTLQWTGNLA